MLSFAACADGLHVATLEAGRLALYALDGSGLGAPLATAAVEGEALVACGPSLLVLDDGPDAVRVTAYAVPTLTPQSALELTGRVKVLAAAGATVLCARPDEAFLLVLGDGTLSTAALRPPATFTRAAGVDDDQLLTFGERGTELWKPSQRRPTARLGLGLPPDVEEIGVTLRHSALWMVGSQPMVQTARLSDGRVVTLRLDAVPRETSGHAGSSYLLAKLDGRPFAINLALRQLEPLDPGPGTIIGQAVGADRVARVVVRLGERVVATALGAEGGPATALTEPAPSSTTIGPTPPGPRPDTAVITTPPRGPTAIGRTGAASEPASIAAAPIAAAPIVDAPIAVVTIADAPIAVAPMAMRAATTVALPPGWRAELLVWAGAGAGPLPASVSAALTPIVERAALAPAAAAVVARCYAAWLDGEATDGSPIARLAIAADDWREACGAGVVARYGLVAWDRGRARLEAAVGEFLDEQRPRAITIVGDGGAHPAPPGLHDLEPGESAELAERFGAVALAAGAELARARLEAWLRGLALVCDARIDPATLRPSEAIFLLPRR